MIAINITRIGLTVDGHAGYAEIGNDIICAAVSALTQGLVHSLKALTNDEISYRIAGGHVDIEYKDLSERGCLLVDSFFIAVSDIQQSYGNSNYTASGFKMIIYGPCINPLIRIAGHIYELRTTLYDGEYAVIDSSTRYAKDRKIVKVKTDGTEENLFNSKNNESSIWEKIPAGLSIVSWNGAFGFDIILFNERGTPRWTLH